MSEDEAEPRHPGDQIAIVVLKTKRIITRFFLVFPLEGTFNICFKNWKETPDPCHETGDERVFCVK